jgi:pimeloyl-ACP methyl ester carboxylesterase
MDTSPHKSSFINSNGVNLHYLDWGGEGDALIFLTGMGCSAHLFDQIAPRFTDKFRVLALTRRGQGESDIPKLDTTSTPW